VVHQVCFNKLSIGRRDVTGDINSKFRRALLCSVVALGVLASPNFALPALSKDGDSGGGNSGSGSSNSGSGSSNSGQDDDRDDDEDDDNSGSGSGTSGKRRDQERALDAVKKGKVRPLGEVLRMVSERAPGDVLRVKLNRASGELFYRITILTNEGRYREVVVDAQSNRVVSMRWR
jgi:uncharacterized membrane protein YkoI